MYRLEEYEFSFGFPLGAEEAHVSQPRQCSGGMECSYKAITDTRVDVVLDYRVSSRPFLGELGSNALEDSLGGCNKKGQIDALQNSQKWMLGLRARGPRLRTRS